MSSQTHSREHTHTHTVRVHIFSCIINLCFPIKTHTNHKKYTNYRKMLQYNTIHTKQISIEKNKKICICESTGCTLNNLKIQNKIKPTIIYNNTSV